MKIYFNIAPKIVLKERNNDKSGRYVPKPNEIHENKKIDIAPESNLQWPDGYMYNSTLLYNWKIW